MRSNTPYEYLNKEGEIEEVYSPSNPPVRVYSLQCFIRRTDNSFSIGAILYLIMKAEDDAFNFDVGQSQQLTTFDSIVSAICNTKQAIIPCGKYMIGNNAYTIVSIANDVTNAINGAYVNDGSTYANYDFMRSFTSLDSTVTRSWLSREM